MISTSDTDFKGIVKNNETAAFIVECLKTDNAIIPNNERITGNEIHSHLYEMRKKI